MLNISERKQAVQSCQNAKNDGAALLSLPLSTAKQGAEKSTGGKILGKFSTKKEEVSENAVRPLSLTSAIWEVFEVMNARCGDRPTNSPRLVCSDSLGRAAEGAGKN